MTTEGPRCAGKAGIGSGSGPDRVPCPHRPKYLVRRCNRGRLSARSGRNVCSRHLLWAVGRSMVQEGDYAEVDEL